MTQPLKYNCAVRADASSYTTLVCLTIVPQFASGLDLVFTVLAAGSNTTGADVSTRVAFCLTGWLADCVLVSVCRLTTILRVSGVGVLCVLQ